MLFPAKHISVSIDCQKEQVYAFASDPENFPKWLAFVESISRNSGNSWDAETTLGTIQIELVSPNEFGVLDHMVKLPNGDTFSNTLRVVPNNDGTEVIFTLFQLSGKSEAEFNADAELVYTDLRELKRLLELSGN